MSNHCMVDLETWGTAPGCAVATIGAVVFDPIVGDLYESFYCRIGLKSCLEAGLSVEADAVEWWMKQSDEARKEVAAEYGSLSLGAALTSFRTWWAADNLRYFWCHGATFDEPILGAAFRAAKVVVPWNYSSVRDTRTIFDLAQVKVDRSAGVVHHALDDAKNQARAVCRAYAALGLGSGMSTGGSTESS